MISFIVDFDCIFDFLLYSFSVVAVEAFEEYKGHPHKYADGKFMDPTG